MKCLKLLKGSLRWVWNLNKRSKVEMSICFKTIEMEEITQRGHKEWEEGRFENRIRENSNIKSCLEFLFRAVLKLVREGEACKGSAVRVARKNSEEVSAAAEDP